MRRWVKAVAEPNRIAAQVFTTSPMNVSTLGLIRDSASQRTMVSSSIPQARPKALVQLWEVQLLFGELFEEAGAAIRHPPFRSWPRRESCSGLGFPVRVCRWG